MYSCSRRLKKILHLKPKCSASPQHQPKINCPTHCSKQNPTNNTSPLRLNGFLLLLLGWWYLSIVLQLHSSSSKSWPLLRWLLCKFHQLIAWTKSSLTALLRLYRCEWWRYWLNTSWWSPYIAMWQYGQWWCGVAISATFADNAGGATWWLNLQPIQVVPPGGQICNQCKWRHLLAKIVSNASGANWWQMFNSCKWC